MYKTTNSGNNWSVNFSGYGFLNSSLFFVNEYVGYSIGYSNTTGNSQVIRTTDAGLNWFAQSLTYRLMNVYFININTGFLIGDRILKTVNGGNNWYTVYDSSFYHTVENNNMLYSIDFNGYSEGIAVGSTSVLKTTNFGENWVRMSKTKTDNVICELMILDSNRVFAVGENGMILFTQNQGTDWNKINSGTIKQLNSICNVGDNKLFCVGDEGAIIYSTNNGLNWTDKSFSSIENIKDIAFLNITTGYLASSINISSQSGIYKTTNGGINWVLKTSNNNFNALQVIDSMKCYGVCRSTSHFIKTTNGGVNWIFKSMTNTGWMESIYFLNENTGFIGGFYGHIYKTSDSGNNWVLQNLWSTDEDINDICFVNENIGYAVSEWGKFLWTTNSGNNWTLNRFSNDYQYLTFCTVDFLNQNTGYIAGYDGNIMKTTTSGLFLTGTSNSSVDISNYYSLSQNYPNPFNPQTKIKFDVPANVRGQTSNVKLIVYDLLGREVATLVNEELKPGTYEADWDGSNFSSGVYFYKIISGDFVETKKMVLMK
ncbi:MAG: T9SS type A sorting domain-containing protein [Candidatus Kapabacteria bacterium]|nr:T9SS type A sorting domain-containing protein [Candidatus Kapabacteria bacterium]